MIRMFQLLTTCTSLTLSTYAFSVSSFNGFYAGAGVGWSQTNARINASATASHILANTGSSSVTGQSTSITTSGIDKNLKDSGIGLLSFGYNHKLGSSPVFMALEAFFNGSSRKTANESAAASNVVKSTPVTFAAATFGQNAVMTSQTQATLNSASYGFDLRPGFVVNEFNALVYGRVGVSFSQLELNSYNQLQVTNTYSNNLPNTSAPSTLNTSTNKNISGLRLGLGAEKRVNQHFSFFLDYVHTYYGSVSTAGKGNVISPQATPFAFFPVPTAPLVAYDAFTSQARTTVSTNQVVLGFRYYFA